MKIEPKFFICDEPCKSVWNKYGVFFSNRFCGYFSDSVEKIMLTECNLKASYKVSLSLFNQTDNAPMYEPGIVSALNIAISILPEFTDNIKFCWKSKTGDIIKTTDEDFDEENLICWMEGLKPKLYWEQAYSKKAEHPFKIKNLPYELEVIDFGILMCITIEVSDCSNCVIIADSISGLIEEYNEKSLAKDREGGVIHNSSYEITLTGIQYRIDLGSAGISFIKKVLRKLSKYPAIKKVSLDL